MHCCRSSYIWNLDFCNNLNKKKEVSFVAVNPQATSGPVVFYLALSLPQRDCKPNSSISCPLRFEKIASLSWDKGFSLILFSAQRWCGRCFLNSCRIISSFQTFQSGNDSVCLYTCIYISIAKIELKKVFYFVQTKGNQALKKLELCLFSRNRYSLWWHWQCLHLHNMWSIAWMTKLVRN